MNASKADKITWSLINYGKSIIDAEWTRAEDWNDPITSERYSAFPDPCFAFSCRLPGLLAGPTQTTLLRGRAAWTLLPAGLAICRWSILRWGWTLCSLKIKSPSWGRNIETLNDFEEPAGEGRGGEREGPDCSRSQCKSTDSWSQIVLRMQTCKMPMEKPTKSWLQRESPCAGLLQTTSWAAGRSRLGCVQFHYGTLNNYFLKWLLCRFKLF